jgi:uncharacterized protein YndB with AHSA1/START domain
MTSTTQTAQTTQVYRVWIRATPQAIWDAITKPEWTDRYGYTGLADYDLRPGGSFRVVAGEEMESHGYTGPMVDGEVIEADPPRKLVQTWRLLMDPQLEAEGFTRLTYEIEDTGDGVARLTVTHDLEDAPGLATMVRGSLEDTGAGGGWGWILSDLKSLLETGQRLRG